MILKLTIIFSLSVFFCGGIAQAAGIKAKVSGRDCKRLVQHQVSAEVNYKPGVDVRGRRVAGANVAGGIKLKLPKTVEFNIAFNPLKGTAATRFGTTSSRVGKVKYDISKNGFTFNGEPMNDKAVAELARKCRSAGR
jgi:hypothetical protein